MKVIGLLGGMSWESSVEYYRIINEEVKENWEGCIQRNAFYTALILRKLNSTKQKEIGKKPVKY